MKAGLEPFLDFIIYEPKKSDDECSTQAWGNTPAGTVWGNNVGTASAIGGHTDHEGKVAWHTWGSGLTMRLTDACEMGAWSGCASGPSIFQIRYN